MNLKTLKSFQYSIETLIEDIDLELQSKENYCEEEFNKTISKLEADIEKLEAKIASLESTISEYEKDK